jgi:hypothetical protein
MEEILLLTDRLLLMVEVGVALVAQLVRQILALQLAAMAMILPQTLQLRVRKDLPEEKLPKEVMAVALAEVALVELVETAVTILVAMGEQVFQILLLALQPTMAAAVVVR